MLNCFFIYEGSYYEGDFIMLSKYKEVYGFFVFMKIGEMINRNDVNIILVNKKVVVLYERKY
jgi:hypothetical protein